MRKLVFAGGVLVVLAVALVVGWRVYSGPAAPPPQVTMGQTVKDVTLPDASGQPHSLRSLMGEKGLLIIFIATRCPVSNAYNQRMEALANDYAARGIPVVGINANRTEPAAEVRQHAQENHLTFTILKDDGNRFADYLGASVTPEAYLLDPTGKLIYHGRLDADRDQPELNANEMRAALDAFLAGQPLANTGKKAFGCTIKRVSSS